MQSCEGSVALRSCSAAQYRPSHPTVVSDLNHDIAGHLKDNSDHDIEEQVTIGGQISEQDGGDAESQSCLFCCIVTAYVGPKLCSDEGPCIGPSTWSPTADRASIVLSKRAATTILAKLVKTSGEDRVHKAALTDGAHVERRYLDWQIAMA
jgi:hypothetical protein